MKKIFFLLAAYALICSCNDTKPPTITAGDSLFVRKNANTQAADSDLIAYNIAMDSMRKMDCSNPLSWYYQGAIHNLPPYDTLLKYGGMDSLCPSYKEGLKAGWATCPHMKPGLEQFHFLTWHRLYLYYLEKIVRKLSGKKDFALPYWNYNDTAGRILPAAFRDAKKFSGLYEPERSPSLMKGERIDGNGTDAIVMNVQILGKDTILVVEPTVAMKKILDTSYLWTAGDIHHFSYELEDVVHNCMHDYVGGTVAPADTSKLGDIWNRIYQQNAKAVGGALMGDIPSSAFDPIFYLHHCNIDRLWFAWETDHPSLQLTLKEFEKAGWGTKDDPIKYVFFDENGKKVEYTSFQQIYDTIRSVNYTYDYLQSKAKAVKLSEAKPLVTGVANVVGTTAPATTIDAATSIKVVNVPFSAGTNINSNTFYALEIDASFAKAPKTRMAVSLIGKTPTDKQVTDVNAYFVGWIGFFGSTHSKGAHQNGMQMSNEPLKRLITLDITDELKKQDALNKGQIKVVLQLDNPKNQPAIKINSVTIKRYEKN
jgi:Common central domain of tyrosinase